MYMLPMPASLFLFIQHPFMKHLLKSQATRETKTSKTLIVYLEVALKWGYSDMGTN